MLPACQRLGLGGLLLSRIEAEVVKAGRTKLLVGTYAANAGAISFYKKHGFRPVADSQTLLAEYWDIPLDRAAGSIVLRKDL